MTNLLRVTQSGTVPEVTRPDPAKVISGDPVHTTWNVDERGALFAGLWHSTVGAWACSYSEWEYVHILEGVSVLTDGYGNQTTLRAGDSYIIRPGFAGTWRVVEPTLKEYVIVT